MEIIKYSKNLILPKRNRYIALGVFDGVHLGHQKLIKYTVNKAKKNNGVSIVITFNPHPEKIIIPENNVFLLSTLEEKINLIKDLNADIFLIIKFTKMISRMSPKDFIRNILVDNLKVKELFVGFNYKFGFQGKGNVDCLKEYGKMYNFKTNILKPEIINKTIISSTKIKEYINLGDIEKAKRLLGHNIIISGRVIPGKGRGKELLNFATANIETPLEKIIPANGVYLVEITISNQKYHGLINIGVRPTFKEIKRTIEAHIINFNHNIYNKRITINILKKIRNERFFSNTELLKKQIEKDISIARKIIDKRNNILN
ncbi:MAG: bifunctional riboflavin kinase/FAD synthetase [Candidatus Atribacteria bacterium]